MKKTFLIGTTLAALTLALQTQAAPVVLTFEGLQDSEQVLEFYNGGTGGNGSSGIDYGISFGADSLALTSGNYGNNPSVPTILFFLSGPGAIMNSANGFSTGFSFYYAAFQSGSVSVYDGLNGSGNLLATLPLPATPNPAYEWHPIGVGFNGTAKSVLFGGAADTIGFDDITLGSETPGHAVPDGGATAGMLAAGLAGIFLMRRKA